MKNIEVRIVNLDFLPGTQVDAKLCEWLGVDAGTSFCESEHLLVKSLTAAGVVFYSFDTHAGTHSILFWREDQKFITKDYPSRATALASALDFVRQVEQSSPDASVVAD